MDSAKDLINNQYTANHINFADVSDISWGFEGSNLASTSRTTSADLAFGMRIFDSNGHIESHNIVVDAFRSIVDVNISNPNSSFIQERFSLNNLVNGQWSMGISLDSMNILQPTLGGDHEGKFYGTHTTDANGKNIVNLHSFYSKDLDDVLQREVPQIDNWETLPEWYRQMEMELYHASQE